MPTKNDYFEEFKSKRLSGASGTARRVGHSFTNYFQSIDRTNFGIQQGKSLGRDGLKAFSGGSTLDAGLKAVGTGATLLGTGGLAAGIVTIAASSLATAAAIAALSGPQAAIVGGVVGIVIIARSVYSNREAAHDGLTKYCWSLIDDWPPTPFATKEELYEASSAALSLLDDGKGQIKLLATKLEAAKQKLDRLNAQLKANETEIGNLPIKASGQASSLTVEKIKRLKEQNQALIEEAKKPGGGIYEYTRRIIHTSNYIQAPFIVSLAMKERHSPGSVVGVAQGDYFAGTALGTNTRGFFTQLATIYEEIVTAPGGRRAGAAAITASSGRSVPETPVVARSRAVASAAAPPVTTLPGTP